MKTKNIIFAITGGIGSGKSTIAQLILLQGIPVYFADIRSKYLVDNNNEIIISLKNLLGNHIYENNTLNKKMLTEYIFNDKNLLLTFNNIIHPVVQKDFIEWVSKQHTKIIAIETAILFESKFDDLVDIIVNVTSPVEQRILRCMKRDNVSREIIQARINNQLSDEERNKRSTYSVVNDNHHSVISQVNKIISDIAK